MSASEAPRFVGRALVAPGADPDKTRWQGASLSSGPLAQEYGFDLTDLDGSAPNCWHYLVEVQGFGLPADVAGYR